MINVNYCVNCGSTNINSYNSGLHKFVVDRMLGLEKTNMGFMQCKLIHCKVCDFAGVDARFTPEEEQRYYKNYMKEEYINHRCSYDSSKEELLVYSTKDYKIMRRKVLHDVLSKNINLSKINSVLDFGGDTGELIPESLREAKKYILEIENRNIPNDITPINDVSESGPIDLIVCGHTLEHVSYPQDLINQIKTFMNSDSYLYIEVPKELTHGYTHNHYFHEHINQYNLNSLKAIVENNGMVTVDLGELTYPKYINGALYIIGKLK